MDLWTQIQLYGRYKLIFNIFPFKGISEKEIYQNILTKYDVLFTGITHDMLPFYKHDKTLAFHLRL